MANSTIDITEGTGTSLDAEELTVSSATVKRERMQVTGTTAAAIQAVTNADPSASEYGSAMRLVGQVAHDAADIGSPVKIGGKALTDEAAVSASGDRVDAWFSPSGGLFTHPYPVLGNRMKVLGTTLPSGTSVISRNVITIGSAITTAVSLVGAAGAGLWNYVVGFYLTTDAASGVVMTIESGSGPSTKFNTMVLQYQPMSAFAPGGQYLFASDAVNTAINVKMSGSGGKLYGIVYTVASSQTVF
jgi:hypothetical protein